MVTEPHIRVGSGIIRFGTTTAATAESDWDFTAESDLPTSPREAAEEAATRESAMMAVVAAEAESLGLAVGTAVYATSTDGPVVAEILRCLQFTALSGFMFDITINHASARDVWLQF